MNRTHRLSLISTLAAFATLAPASAAAFGIETTGDTLKGNIVRWASPTISYYLDAAGTNGLTAAQSQQCMNSAFADWAAVDCTALRFTNLGTTTNKQVLPMSTSYNTYENGKNELVWINDSKWTFGQQVLGVTMVNGSWNWSGSITEGDIAFNGRDYKWNLTGTIGYFNNDMDCKSVIIHEIGHLFGLQHVLSGASVTDPPTMAPAVDPNGKSATLSRDDQLGACFLYPVSSYYTCTKNSECPKVVGHNSSGDEIEVGQIYCQNTYCQGGGGVAPNTVELGGTCLKATDCVSGLACDTLSSGVMMCSRACVLTSDDCPDGFHCEVPLGTGATTPICVPGSKKKVAGDACASSYECSTNFCNPAPDGSGMTCRVACTVGGPACPDGQACWASAYSSAGGCYPSSIVPQPKKVLGAECAAQGECESGLCYAAPNDVARCLRPCDIASPVCYVGYYCMDMGNGSGACAPGDGKKAAGLECAGNAECSSQWCVGLVTDGKSWCRTSCDLTTWVCDTGFACVSFGSTDFGVCMPSNGKKAAGESCTANSDCISTMCRDFGTAGSMCTQNCVGGTCPNDWHCYTGDAWGPLCAPPGFDPQPASDPGTTEEDRGTPIDEDVVQPTQELGPGDEDSGYVAPQPVKSRKGCTAGAAPAGVVPALMPLLLAFGAMLARRRRRP